MFPQLRDAIRVAARFVRHGRDLVAIESAALQGLVPPRQTWGLVGDRHEFSEQGAWFFRFLVEHGRITRDASVLDIGCGLGKHAVHFADFLASPSRYEGFDVEPLRIRWCRRAISRRHPNFRFTYAPLQNRMYSPGAKAAAADFRFPYASGSFDFAFAASVFTHMFDADVARYAQETARVLKPGGRFIATFYLLNAVRRRATESGAAAFKFEIPHEGSWIELAEPPEAAVAHDHTRVLDIFTDAGLTLAEPVRYGVWDHSPEQDQDFLVLEKLG